MKKTIHVALISAQAVLNVLPIPNQRFKLRGILPQQGAFLNELVIKTCCHEGLPFSQEKKHTGCNV